MHVSVLFLYLTELNAHSSKLGIVTFVSYRPLERVSVMIQLLVCQVLVKLPLALLRIVFKSLLRSQQSSEFARIKVAV